MGLFDRIFGDAPRPPAAPAAPSDDEQAIARYRYLLRTAPPEAIEQAHAEAFAKLTPEQRRTVLVQLRAATPEGARDATPVMSDPQALARYATRTEIRQPGTLERTFGAMPATGGPGFGAMIASSLLGSMAGTVLGTAIAHEFLGQPSGMEAGGVAQPHATEPFPDPSLQGAIDDSGGDFDLPDTFDV